MSKKFYTADLHLNHQNILTYCNRPFKNVNEMNETLIDNWNQKVGKNDLVYVLGDFTLSTHDYDIIRFASLLKGKKFLIKGNHDKNNYPSGVFEEITWYKEIHDLNYKIILFHYAIENWQGSFDKDLRLIGKKPSIHLHGHSHGLSNKRPNRYDVGVDCWNYAPVTLTEILNV